MKRSVLFMYELCTSLSLREAWEAEAGCLVLGQTRRFLWPTLDGAWPRVPELGSKDDPRVVYSDTRTRREFLLFIAEDLHKRGLYRFYDSSPERLTCSDPHEAEGWRLSLGEPVIASTLVAHFGPRDGWHVWESDAMASLSRFWVDGLDRTEYRDIDVYRLDLLDLWDACPVTSGACPTLPIVAGGACNAEALVFLDWLIVHHGRSFALKSCRHAWQLDDELKPIHTAADVRTRP